MISAASFINFFAARGVDYVTGVPDSLLKGLISAFDSKSWKHHIAVNEGAAIAMASGYHLASGKIPLVYLQNSGMGNTINPLTSLADPAVYGIPMVLLIGWRGRPGIKDEPQHIKMGKISRDLLQALDLPFITIEKERPGDWESELAALYERALKEQRPVAVLIGEDIFEPASVSFSEQYEMNSEAAIGILYDHLQPDDVAVCTTGKIGRVFYSIHSKQQKIPAYFLNVGSMGHALSIATGMATVNSSRIFVFDGDGSLLMHMGALAAAAGFPAIHCFLLNNGAHQSVGGQPTLGFDVDFVKIAEGAGFRAGRADDREQLKSVLAGDYNFFEIRINQQTAEDLPRPKESAAASKERFMKLLKNK